MSSATAAATATPANLEQKLYGVLPWRRTKRGEIKVLLVAPRGGEHWSLPSGLPGNDRTPRQTAMSEAFEKAGVVGHLDAGPIGSYSSQAAAPSPCVVEIYRLKVRGTLTNWPASTRCKRRWFRLDDAIQVVSNAGLKQLLASIGGNETPFGADRKAA
ncbi:NUDIX hydrolase [Pseudaminobacter soli (ex Li et al. 2025)]|uniref:NUDIX hydrolase n=1 Tax=Pseudaminobacter soli (ex Li et al. 2025) TaxID=1295366 RepID=UPI0024754ABF|nr:NUDIX domain-containing protein [Mesorhizobium soli]